MSAETIPDLGLPTKNVDDFEVPILEKPYSRILEAIETGGELDMLSWHGHDINKYSTTESFCGTVHCIAGWTIRLCGAQGKALEDVIGPTDAGSAILRASSELEQPCFYGEGYVDELTDVITNAHRINRIALETIRDLARQEAESAV
jgi:hypothetical protein